MEHPKRKIEQISNVVVPIESQSVIDTTARCDDGTVWTISRVVSTGQFVGDGWTQYPDIPQGGAL